MRQQENLRQVIAVIRDISSLTTSGLDLEAMLQVAVESIHSQLRYPDVALLIVDPGDQETLVLQARHGAYSAFVPKGYRQTIHQGVIGRAARTRRRILIGNVRDEAEYLPIPGAPRILSELAVPILIGDRLLGVLNVESETAIPEEDAVGFEIVAEQLAIAIDNAKLLDEMRQKLDETRLLHETSQRISTASDVEGVIDAYLEQVAARGRYACNVVLYHFDERGQRFALDVLGRWTPQAGLSHPGDRHPYIPDDLDPILDAGQTVTFADVTTDPGVPEALRAIQARSGRPAIALIPLMVRDQRIGSVVLSHSAPMIWEEDDLRPYQVTAAQLATAIDSRRQQQLLLHRSQRVAVLEERQRLARELHDSVTQLIFSITLIAQSIGPAWGRSPEEGEKRVQRVLELSRVALAEMRALLFELKPPEVSGAAPAADEAPPPGILRLWKNGLVAALRAHIEALPADELHITFGAETYSAQPSAVEETLYRVAQEALSNVIRHANARRVLIELGADAANVSLTISDDGSGFPSIDVDLERRQGEANTHSGLGLRTMRERAEGLGGTLKVHSTPGRGTKVVLRIPRKEGGWSES